MSGLIGGAAITWFDRHTLGLVGAVFIAIALLVAELAQKRIARPDPQPTGAVAVTSGVAR